jgi:hypothetical protein
MKCTPSPASRSAQTIVAMSELPRTSRHDAAPGLLDPGAHGRDPAAGLASDDQRPQAQLTGGHADDVLGALAHVEGEVRRRAEGRGAEVARDDEQALDAGLGPDGQDRRAGGPEHVHDRHAAGEALAHRPGVQRAVAGADAAGAQRPCPELRPRPQVGVGQSEVVAAPLVAGADAQQKSGSCFPREYPLISCLGLDCIWLQRAALMRSHRCPSSAPNIGGT